jgi:hypothetical protein
LIEAVFAGPMLVRSNYSYGASTILEQASEAVMRLNRVAALFGFIAITWNKQFVVVPLVISLAMRGVKIILAVTGSGGRHIFTRHG